LVGIVTNEGTDVEVTPGDSETGETPVTITFAEITESGGTSLTISDTGEEPPAGFELAGEYYDISTTASYTGTIEVCVQYDDTGLTPEQENGLQLYHYDDAIEDWVDCTVSIDTGGDVICGSVTSLSPFAVLVDVEAPTISNISADPDVLWPANHKMVEVRVTVEAEDNAGQIPMCVIVGVESNESENGQGDGNTEQDWEFTDDDLTVLLRAERDGGGAGRVYTIFVTCTDASGNYTDAIVEVTVPHDQGKGGKKK